MILNVTEIEINKKESYQIDEQFEDYSAHATGELIVQNSNDFVSVKGILDVILQLECVRCLKKFEKEIEIEIDEKYFKGTLNQGKSKEHHIENLDFAEELDETNEIDLSDLIYQSIIVNVPNQNFCDINCIGTPKLQEYLKADENLQRVEIRLKKNKE